MSLLHCALSGTHMHTQTHSQTHAHTDIHTETHTETHNTLLLLLLLLLFERNNFLVCNHFHSSVLNKCSTFQPSRSGVLFLEKVSVILYNRTSILLFFQYNLHKQAKAFQDCISSNMKD